MMKIRNLANREIRKLIPDAENIQILSMNKARMSDTIICMLSTTYMVRSEQLLKLKSIEIDNNKYEDLEIKYNQIIRPDKPISFKIDTSSGDLEFNTMRYKMKSISKALISELKINNQDVDEDTKQIIEDNLKDLIDDYPDDIEILNQYQPTRKNIRINDIEKLDKRELQDNSNALLHGASPHDIRYVESQFKTNVDKYIKDLFGEYEVDYRAYLDKSKNALYLIDVTVNGRNAKSDFEVIPHSPTYQLVDGFIQDAHQFDSFIKMVIESLRTILLYNNKEFTDELSKNINDFVENISEQFDGIIKNVKLAKYQILDDPQMIDIDEKGVVSAQTSIKYNLNYQMLENNDTHFEIDSSDFIPEITYQLETTYDGQAIDHTSKINNMNIELSEIKCSNDNQNKQSLTEKFDQDQIEEERLTLVQLCNTANEEVEELMNSIKYNEKVRI